MNFSTKVIIATALAATTNATYPFKLGVPRTNGDAELIGVSEANALFAEYDTDNNGSLGASEVEAFFTQHNYNYEVKNSKAMGYHEFMFKTTGEAEYDLSVDYDDDIFEPIYERIAGVPRGQLASKQAMLKLHSLVNTRATVPLMVTEATNTLQDKHFEQWTYNKAWSRVNNLQYDSVQHQKDHQEAWVGLKFDHLDSNNNDLMDASEIQFFRTIVPSFPTVNPVTGETITTLTKDQFVEVVFYGAEWSVDIDARERHFNNLFSMWSGDTRMSAELASLLLLGASQDEVKAALGALVGDSEGDSLDVHEFVPIALASEFERPKNVEKDLALTAEVFDSMLKLADVGLTELTFAEAEIAFMKLSLKYSAAEIQAEEARHGNRGEFIATENFATAFFECKKQSEKLDVNDEDAMRKAFNEMDAAGNGDGLLSMSEAYSLLARINVDKEVDFAEFTALAQDIDSHIGPNATQ